VRSGGDVRTPDATLYNTTLAPFRAGIDTSSPPRASISMPVSMAIPNASSFYGYLQCAARQ